MPNQPEPGTAIAVEAPISRELAEQFRQMAMMIPDETGDAVENILGTILAAEAWDDLDAPWDSVGAERLAGRTVIIHRIVRRPSDYRDGLGVFLVVHYTDPKTGEAGVFTTSSISIVGQLVRAYAKSWLPIHAQVVVAERPTEAGYKPHHLKFLGPVRTTAAQGPAS